MHPADAVFANIAVSPRLRLYCDQFLDKIAADRSKVPVQSQCRMVVVGRTGCRTVAVAFLVIARNFKMIKKSDTPIFLAATFRSQCTRSAVGLRSYCGRSATLHSVSRFSHNIFPQCQR